MVMGGGLRTCLRVHIVPCSVDTRPVGNDSSCSSNNRRRRWMEEEEEEEEEEEGISTATERVCWGRPRQKAATV